MYRVLFVSRERTFVVVKNLPTGVYYVFDSGRLLNRFDHWAQRDSLLNDVYDNGNAERIFEKNASLFNYRL